MIFKVGAYSRGGLIRAWGLVRGFTVIKKVVLLGRYQEQKPKLYSFNSFAVKSSVEIALSVQTQKFHQKP